MSLHIYAENFRSYPLIDWTLPNGLSLIDGQNRDIGGSNGAGKSTLFDAWAWCRYGWLPKWEGPKGGPADGVVRKKGGESLPGCLVRITETFTSDKIVIERKRPHKLRVWKNDEEQKGMTQESLDELLGMLPERFLLSVLLHQKRQKSFFKMSDSERMDLFSIISGLEDIERSYLEAKKLRDDASLMIDKLSHGMGIYTEQLKELPGKISLLNERKSLARDSWEIENGIYEASVLEKETFLSMHSKESFLDSSALSERQSKTVSLKEEIKKLFEKHGEWKKSLDDTPKPEPELFDLVNGLNEKIREAEYQEDFANHIKEENKRLMVVIQERLRMAECARDGKCDSCGQILPEIERQGSIMKQINLAKESEAQIKEIPEIPDLKTLYLALDSAKQKFDDRRAELSARPSQIKAEMQIIESGIQAKYSEQKQIDAEISAINDRASQAFKDKVSALDGKIKNIEIDKVRAESNWKGFKDSIEEAESQKENLEKKIKETSTLISDQTEARSLYSDLMTVFGPKGYRSICFDGLVARIGKRAGEIMEIMTQSIYSTYLNQVSEDSKGNMKLILKPTVLCRGKEVPKDFLSGGLEDRISLAYDVSISEAAGDGLPLLLDEVLSALDDVGKAEAMVLLETISKTRPVLVIDHASEFKAMFTNTIKVTYENEESVLSM